jgi:hypothetical protein
MNEECEQTDGKLVEVRPWELVDPHVLHVWEMAPIPVLETIPICYKVMYCLNPTSPDLLVTKKCGVSGAPWRIPHLHDLVDCQHLTFPSPLEIGWELDAFHFLDLLMQVEWIEVV